MVLRKPVPGTQLPAANENEEPPYPATPVTPSRPPPPPPPQKDVYSPSLHDSPAFNLQSLDEAQRSPTNQQPAGIEDEGLRATEGESNLRSKIPTLLKPGAGRGNPENSRPVDNVPAQLRPGGEGTPRSSFDSQDSQRGLNSSPLSYQGVSPPRLQSNNPFLKMQPSGNNAAEQPGAARDASSSQWSETFTAPQTLQEQNNVKPDEPPVQMTASLSISDPPFSEFSSSYQPSNSNLSAQYQGQAQSSDSISSVAMGKRPEPPALNEQPPLIAVPPPVPAQQDYTDYNSWDDTKSHNTLQQPIHDPQASLNSQLNYYSQPQQSMQSFFNEQQTNQNQQPSYDTHQSSYQQQPTASTNSEDPWASIDGFVPNNLSVSQKGPVEDNSGSLIDFEENKPPLPVRPPKTDEEAPPPKPPRPQQRVETEEELAKAAKQRAETYQIRQINWLDNNAMRQSPVLLQNANGPCPLLALVNAFALSTPANVESPLIRALRTREQITLGLLMDAIFDELTSGPRGRNELPDVGNLYKFLVRLHTGMNVNPQFVGKSAPPNLMDARNSMLHLSPPSDSDRNPGEFEETEEIRLYGTIGIPLIHGWLPPRSHPAFQALERRARTYEDAQNILFREEELEEKLSNEGLSADEQQMFNDIGLIKHFLSSTATQLTAYGLEVISGSLSPGSIAIFFRNDHFNTLYKHPLSNQLLTLVTDAGYATHDEIVWESLVDVTGEGCDFFAGDFRPVGNASAESLNRSQKSSHQHSKSRSRGPTDSEGFTLVSPRRSNHSRNVSAAEPSPQSPAVLQEDADLALALQLQEEEDDRARRAAGNRESRIPSQHQPGAPSPNPRPGTTPNSNLTQARPQGTSTPPTIVTQGRRNRSSTSQSHPRSASGQEVRPAIPPRTSRNQGVSRPIDDADDAPPSYEQAARGTPYIPPEMLNDPSVDARPPYSPIDPSPTSSSMALGNTPSYSAYQDDRRRRGPRLSVPAVQSQMPGGYPSGRYRGGGLTTPVSATDERRGRDKDCIVM